VAFFRLGRRTKASAADCEELLLAGEEAKKRVAGLRPASAKLPQIAKASSAAPLTAGTSCLMPAVTQTSSVNPHRFQSHARLAANMFSPS
jgi:hypothetical protein